MPPHPHILLIFTPQKFILQNQSSKILAVKHKSRTQELLTLRYGLQVSPRFIGTIFFLHQSGGFFSELAVGQSRPIRESQRDAPAQGYIVQVKGFHRFAQYDIRMGRKSFCSHFRGIVRVIEVSGMSSPTTCSNENNNIMTIDTDKAKCALATLQEENRAQQHRLQLAAQAKRKLDAALHTQLPISNRVFRAEQNNSPLLPLVAEAQTMIKY